MTPQDVAALCELMVRYRLTLLEYRNELRLERPAQAALAVEEEKPEPEPEEDELAALARRSPDAIDAALARGRLDGGA